MRSAASERASELFASAWWRQSDLQVGGSHWQFRFGSSLGEGLLRKLLKLAWDRASERVQPEPGGFGQRINQTASACSVLVRALRKLPLSTRGGSQSSSELTDIIPSERARHNHQISLNRIGISRRARSQRASELVSQRVSYLEPRLCSQSKLELSRSCSCQVLARLEFWLARSA